MGDCFKFQNLCTMYLKAKRAKQFSPGEYIDFDFCKYRRSYVILRNPIFCLSNQFSLNWCCTPSMVHFEKKYSSLVNFEIFQAIKSKKTAIRYLVTINQILKKKTSKKPNKLLKKNWKKLYICYIEILFPPKKVGTFSNSTIDGAQHWLKKTG